MRTNPNRKVAQKKYYQLNHQIFAKELRVIDKEGKQVGLLSKDKALEKAQKLEVDLVLIAPNAKPPVAKLIEFNKFLYQEEKKQKQAKKGVKKSIAKDIKLSLFIAPADFKRMVEKGKEFLNNGNQLRINLTLRGRQMAKQKMGFDLITRYIAELIDASVSKEPRLEGRVIRAVVSKRK